MSVLTDLFQDVKLPNMIRIRQEYPRPVITDLEAVLQEQLSKDVIKEKIKPGAAIAVGVGSRGICNLKEIVRYVVGFLKQQGAEPFIVPAMGSHGGATAEGQKEILTGYGVTEDYCGCPVRATMETVQIGTTCEGHRVYLDRYAANADGIIVINRIKAHTCFRGPHESGLMKMLTIGLGKQRGAESCHNAGFKYMAHLVPLFGNVILNNTNFLFGIALLENAFEETCEIRSMTADDIRRDEPALLEKAKSLMPSLPCSEADVLIVDKIGKNYSGDGMDPNITGTFVTPYATGTFHAQRVVVLDLSDETHGSGIGAGNADVIHKRVFEKTDLSATYPNAITSKVLSCVKIPMMLDSDRDVIACAVKTCTEIDFDAPSIIRIPNSLDIQEMEVSEAVLKKIGGSSNIRILSGPSPFQFDLDGNLL
ncbi:lactate racemase domain-containing protein [Clostridium sp. MCC353]|uniref:lactate racemase domain-containing protein n=1 Tax=Clostridium sp. MCC353 TaxID=2592646 RepID=UPI00207AF34F|nr:lactate racemase domain-containing protein [Clostridium sp. MCC353]